MRRGALACLLASAMAALCAADAFPAPLHKQAPKLREAAKAQDHKQAPKQSKATKAQDHKQAPKLSEAAKAQDHKRDSAPDAKLSAAARERNRAALAIPLPTPRPVANDPAVAALPPDIAAAKQAIELAHQHKLDDAAKLAASIDDPVAHKLVEWVLLRQPESAAGFDRFAAFIRANPAWPSIPLLRQRAEARLWQERRDAATVRRFFNGAPASPAGRIALARVLLSEGDRAGADREVRAVWQSAELSAELEAAVLETFGSELTPADHKARMDRRIGAKDFGAAMRAAKRLGDGEIAIVKACTAAEANAKTGGPLLDAIPAEARHDLGYALCRLHWLLRNDGVAAATKLALALSREDLQRQDTDEWWRELRVLARRLLDLGDARSAYQIARAAAPPANPYYRAEVHFMAGWVALRFLADPATALEHFAHIDDGSEDPIVRARAAYWRGRAAEAAGQVEDMRAQYETAARYPTAYYGQLARARLGLGEIALRRPPPEPMQDTGRELLRAADILYTIGERDLVISFVTDLARASSDEPTLAALGELAARYNDARAMLLVGKTALARGLAMDQYAFPEIGVPPYSPVGPQLDRCIVYSIVRTESSFDPHDMSAAKAVGLMQVTPEAGRDTAKRFGVTYDWNRLVSDQAYNTEMGAAEVAALLKEYRGSYIMTFAGYNAGRGRVSQWVAQHGDPRDPRVDAVDWVERIPFAETRNYVQRVIENLQIYGARFGASTATVEPNLHRAGAAALRAEPASPEQPIPRTPVSLPE
jgi:soluble lytic murein transglycosylase